MPTSTDVFEGLAREIFALGSPERATVVGISGIDAAGKTTFANNLRTQLERSAQVSTIHFDDFHNPKLVRYSGNNDALNYLEKSFNSELFESEILLPLSRAGCLSWRGVLLDLESDKYTNHVRYDVKSGDIALIEGVFLFRRSWKKYFNFRILLSVPPEVAMKRGVERDRFLLGDDAERRYAVKYMAAQKVHFERDHPGEDAQATVDNSCFDSPKLMSKR